MDYQLAPLFCRPWTLNGMTPRLIESHYERNYGADAHAQRLFDDDWQRAEPCGEPFAQGAFRYPPQRETREGDPELTR